MAAMAASSLSSKLSITRPSFFDGYSTFHGTLLRRAPATVSAGAKPKTATITANYDLKSFNFEPIKESIVAREMTRRYGCTSFYLIWRVSLDLDSDF